MIIARKTVSVLHMTPLLRRSRFSGNNVVIIDALSLFDFEDAGGLTWLLHLNSTSCPLVFLYSWFVFSRHFLNQ